MVTCAIIARGNMHNITELRRNGTWNRRYLLSLTKQQQFSLTKLSNTQTSLLPYALTRNQPEISNKFTLRRKFERKHMFRSHFDEMRENTTLHSVISYDHRLCKFAQQIARMPNHIDATLHARFMYFFDACSQWKYN